ncbi:MAG TPA: hypothetical protein VF980_12250 [Thermoanaerobaculia bacterium]
MNGAAYGVGVKAFTLAFLTVLPLGAAEYHIDFARLFPPADTQRTEYSARMRDLEVHRGHLADSSSNFVGALDAYSAALESFERLDAYLYLRYAVDTRQVVLLHDEEALEADFAKRTAFFRSDIAQVTAADAQRLLASDHGRTYLRFIETTRGADGALTLAQTEVVEALAPAVAAWPAELYDTLGKQKDRSGDLYAFALLRLVRARTQLAQLRGYPDAASEVYANAQLTRADARRLFDAVAAATPVYVAFQQRHAALPPIAVKPSYSFDEARTTILAALAPLGRAYVDEMSSLLDPASGRIDITPGEHRLRAGFSKGFPGMTSVFFMSGFSGSYNDVRVITHEGTHAVEREMQTRAHVMPVYASGPKFIMEALAITAELMLPKYLYEHERDPALRRFFLDQLLTSKGLVILFRTAAEAELEERIYDGVTRGEVRSAADLDALTIPVFARYGITVRPDEWTRIPLLFEDPFYDINYTWADLVALELFGTAKSEPAGFAAAYSRALRSGFDSPAATWLKRAFDLDLGDPHLVDRALKTLQPYIGAY